MRESAPTRCLGLIGGLGVGATIHYYRALVAAHAARGLVPRLLIAHAHMERVRPLVDALNEELGSRRFRRVALLGTRFAMETRLFGRLEGVEIARPTAAEMDMVHAAYMRVASTGAGAAEDVEALRRIARRLGDEEGAEAIVLAGTDLSVIFNEGDCGFPAIDATRVHVEAIMRRLLA